LRKQAIPVSPSELRAPSRSSVQLPSLERAPGVRPPQEPGKLELAAKAPPEKKLRSWAR
jgi:hypothetical protein